MFELRPLHPAQIESLCHFIESASGGFMERGRADSVLRTIVSGPESVADVFVKDARVGVAILIDSCDNSADAAELSLFPGPGPDDPTRAMLEWGISLARRGPRTQLDVPLWPGTRVPSSLLSARGFHHAFSLFQMERVAGPDSP